MTPPHPYHYHAFISHSSDDAELARWLRRRLESYRIPRGLQSRRAEPIPRRLCPVFRDADELTASDDIGARLREALDASQALVVLASESAAASRWVREEIDYFRSDPSGRVVRVAIARGPYPACMPPGLGDAGAEPLAVNFDGVAGRRRPFLQLVAGLLELDSVDDLIRRDTIARRWRLAGWVTLMVSIVTILVAVWVARNAPPTVSDFSIDSRDSVATITFIVTDRESDETSIDLYCRIGSGPLRHMTAFDRPPTVQASPSGQGASLRWSYALEPWLDADAVPVRDVTVLAVPSGAPPILAAGGRNGRSGLVLGNTPPSIQAVQEPAQAVLAGTIPIPILLTDAVGDPIDLEVSYREAGDSTWRPARQAGLPPDATAGSPAVSRTPTSPDGTRFVFMWDSFADLGPRTVDALVRVEAMDAYGGVSAPVTIELQGIDNNRRPVATIQGGGFVGSSDDRDLLPVPCSVTDADGDDVLMVLQWAYAADGFPELPSSRAAMLEALARPDERLRLQIATIRPEEASFGVRPTATDDRVFVVDDAVAYHRLLGSIRSRRPALAARGRAVILSGGEPDRASRQVFEVGLDPARQAFTVSDAMQGDVPSDRRWEVKDDPTAFAPTRAAPATGVLLWDSRDAMRGGDVVLRLTPFDRSIGISSTTQRPKFVHGGLPLDTVRVIDTNGERPQEVVAASGATGIRFALAFRTVTQIHEFGASVSARPRLVASIPASLEQLAFEDLDADGLPDLVARNGDRSLVLWRTASDDAAPMRLADAVDAWSLSPAVANRERWIALARRGADGSVLSTARVTASGPADVTEVGPIGSRVSCLAFVDATGDGRLDLVVAGERIEVRRGWLDGVFDPPIVLGARRGLASRIVAHDLDRDGRRDLVVIDDEGDEVAIWYQPEDGWQPTEGPSARLPLNQTTDVEVADLNGDGLPDLIASDYGHNEGGNVAIFMQASPRRFLPPRHFGGTDTTHFTRSLELHDLNGDGAMDILVTKPGGDPPFQLTAMIQRRPGDDFVADRIGADRRQRSVSVADLDQDGDLDVVAYGDGIDLYEQVSPRRFTRRAQLTDGRWSHVLDVDLDGDGSLELFGVDQRERRLHVLRLDTATTPWSVDVACVHSRALRGGGGGPFVRRDDAGRPAVAFVAAGDDGDTVSVIRGVAPGRTLERWAELPALPIESGALALATGDIDGDGNRDVVVAVAGGIEVRDAGGATVARLALPGCQSVAMLDIDGDASLDLVCGARGRLWVFRQHEPGRFVPTLDRAIDGLEGLSDVGIGDIDGDGDLDLAIGLSSSSGDPLDDEENRIAVLRHEADGAFVPWDRRQTLGTYDTTNFVRSVVVVDLDGDGNADVLGAASPGVAVFWSN